MQKIKVGILQIDYSYPPLLGDVAHPDSHSSETIFETVYGLTFDLCQKGIWNDSINLSITTAVKNLES